MSRMHWWIMAVGAVFFLWFFIPAFVVVNIGNITGMAVSALVLLYGIFYRQVQDVAGDFGRRAVAERDCPPWAWCSFLFCLS